MSMEHQQVETILDPSPDIYRALFNQIDQGFCVIKVIFDQQDQAIDYVFLELNPAFEEQTGIKNAKGQRISQLMPDNEEYLLEMYGHIALTGQSQHFENWAAPSNRWYDIHGFPVGEAAQRQVAIFFKDITKRKQVEADLQKARDELEIRIAQCAADYSQTVSQLHQLQEESRKEAFHYRQALNFTNTGSWEFEIATERVIWSDKIEEIWGLESGTFTGELEQVKIAIHPDDLDSWQQDVQACIEYGIEHNLEYRVIHPDDSVHWVQAIGNAEFNAQGKATRLRGLVRDITERKQLELDLRDSETRFRNMADNSPVMIWVTDETGNCNYVSQSWCHFTGQKRESAWGKGWLDFIHPDDQGKIGQRFQDSSDQQEAFRLEYRLQDHNGQYHWVIDAAKPWLGVNGQFKGYIGSVIDISDRKTMEEKLRIFERIVSFTPDLMAFVQRDYTYQLVNDAYAQRFNRKPEELIGQSVASTLGEDVFRKVVQSYLDRCFKGEDIQYQEWFQVNDNQKRYFDVRYSPYREIDNTISGTVVTIRDITELNHLAHHDHLTHLPNRLLLQARLEQSVQKATRNNSKLAVIFIDLDRFKHINDSMGHAAGDSLLQQLAQRLSQNLRKSDTIARISGDEFVAVLEDIEDIQHAGMGLAKLMSAFEEPFALEGQAIHVTASMGLSLFPDDGTETDILLRNADTAMYRAKEEGRNTYRFYVAEMTSQAFEYVFFENALRTALKNNQFHLVYQPQIDLESRRWIGVEALLRWYHPTLGIVSPSQFIPIAEQSGLIREIGRWVLNQACHQAKAWLDQGLEFGHIAVNVAAPQLYRNYLISVIENALQSSGLPPQYLELELTESVVMRQTEAKIEQFRLLQQMGVKLSIDDFGTGYSSLAYLKQLPIDKLKIDRSFIRDIPHDSNDIAISEAIIALGKALNLNIIAEGVETPEQVAFLQEKGCDLAQGYLYSRPLSAKAFQQQWNQTPI